MVKKRVKKKMIKRMFFLIPGTMILLIVLVTTIGKYWVEIAQKYKEKAELSEKLSNLKDDEIILSADVLKLQDPEYVARYAREKYGFSKNGEIILKFNKK